MKWLAFNIIAFFVVIALFSDSLKYFSRARNRESKRVNFAIAKDIFSDHLSRGDHQSHQFSSNQLESGPSTVSFKRHPYEVRPPYDLVSRERISQARDFAFRKTRRFISSNCGIFWSVTSINGSRTNYDQLSQIGGGEGKFRLLMVLYEAYLSAARVRTIISRESLPSICSKGIELSLYIDRSILVYFSNLDLIEDAKCIFNHIVYYDDILPDESILDYKPAVASDIFNRIPSRPNALKLFTLASSPYRFSLFLDGDTSPCSSFHHRIFQSIADNDLMATPNPFGYVSTNGKKTYPGSPPFRTFEKFEEINGGIVGYQSNNRTMNLFVRSLELLPSFQLLGFDQDQAVVRQALFESLMNDGLVMTKQPMHRFCRYGWSCERNDCSQGCWMIHSRLCTDFGVNYDETLFNNTCRPNIHAIFDKHKLYSGKYLFYNKKNRKNRKGLINM